MKKKTPQRTKGDVLRINITPWKGKKSDTFPWVRIFTHPHGIRYAADQKNSIEEGPRGNESKKEFAQRLGIGIVQKSKILRKWFK